MIGLRIFRCSALVHGFVSNLLNLCNLRNLWIFPSSGSGLVDAKMRSPLTLLRMKLRLVLEPDSETNRWAAFFPELMGYASAGDSEEEAVRNAKEALELWFKPSPLRSQIRLDCRRAKLDRD